jgi:5-formyltetrahydrofolate cyclo-ligase
VSERGELRRRVLGLREVLDPVSARTESEQVCRNLHDITELEQARIIMAYAPVRKEVDVTFYWEQARAQGKIVLLPRVEAQDLVAVEFTGWENTRPGAFGIPEPVGPPYRPELIEAILVPGVVFDRACYRLGYGKGFYDRFLAGLSSSVFTCGAAYDFQIVDSVFPQAHDVRLNRIVCAHETFQPAG